MSSFVTTGSAKVTTIKIFHKFFVMNLPEELQTQILDLCLTNPYDVRDIRPVCKSFANITFQIYLERGKRYRSVHNVMFYYKEIMLARGKEFKCRRVVYTHTRKDETLESMISRCKITIRPELTSCRWNHGEVQLKQRLLIHEYLSDIPKGVQLPVDITFMPTFYLHLYKRELKKKLREFGLPISVATKAELMVCLHEHKMSTDVAYRTWYSVLRKWHQTG